MEHFTIKFEQEISDWSDFRRALREPDRSNFDRAMDEARKNKEAASHARKFSITQAMLMNILIAHQRDLMELAEQIKTLQEE